jgi:hypothetical protein
VWAGWVLGQNAVDPHRPTHSHTLYAYKAYCAPHSYIYIHTAWAISHAHRMRISHALIAHSKKTRRIACDSQPDNAYSCARQPRAG